MSSKGNQTTKNRRYFYKSKLKKKIIITPYTTREYLKKLINVYSHIFKIIEKGHKGRKNAMTIGVL